MADKVQIEIVTTADTSGASKAEESIKQVGNAAKAEMSELEKLRAEAASINAKTSAAPSPEAASPAGGIGAIPTSGVAAAAGITAVVAAARAMISEIADGAQRASEMAQSLDGLDAAARKAAIDGMGPLGALIEDGGDGLARFAADSAAAAGKMDELWTAIGARVAPALDQTAQAIASIDTTKVGAGIGDVLGGMVAYFNAAASTVQGWGEGLKSATGISEEYLVSLGKHVPIMGGIITALEEYTQANKDLIAAQKEGPLSQEAFNEKLRTTADLYKQLATNAQSRADAELPVADQIAKVGDKLAEAKQRELGLSGKSQQAAAAEVLHLDAQLAALQKKKKAEDEVAANKANDSAATAAEYEQRIRLNEAIAAGDKDEQDRIRAAMAGQAALKATGSDEAAGRAYDAEAKILAARRADAEAKAQAERDKGQAATDKKSRQAAEAYDKQQEILAKKREELELETAINEAKALGNDTEVAKLEWLKKYNAILAQKDASGNSVFTEDEARRSANAASAASSSPAAANYVKPGEIAPGTNYRRGRNQSDASYSMAQADQSMGGPGGSLLDAYNANRKTPVGSIEGNDPTKSSGSSNIAGDAKSAAKEIASGSKDLTAAANAVTGAAKALTGGIAEVKKSLAALEAKVNSLSSGT